MSFVTFESNHSEDVFGYLIDSNENYFTYISPFCFLYLEKNNIFETFKTSHLFYLDTTIVSNVKEINNIEKVLGSFFLDMLKFDTSDFKKEEHDSFISLNEQLFSEFKYGSILNKIERVFNVTLYTSFFGYKRLREIFLFIFELAFEHFKELRFELLTDSDLYRKLIFEEI